VKERLGGYVKMSVPDRQEAVKELAAKGHSQREIAELVGVNEKTVRRDAANAAPEEKITREIEGETEASAANAAPSKATDDDDIQQAKPSKATQTRQANEQKLAAALRARSAGAVLTRTIGI
jgi:transposase